MLRVTSQNFFKRTLNKISCSAGRLPIFWHTLKEKDKIAMAVSSPTDTDYTDPEFLFYRAQGLQKHDIARSKMLLISALELNPRYAPARQLLDALINKHSDEDGCSRNMLNSK